MSAQDFSDDITNGGFENHKADEEMLTGGTGDEFQDDSMGASNNPSNNNGDENRNGESSMEHQGNGDSSSAANAATSDQYV